ncbi:MAG: response regulator [Crocinitomicaceae bacterium]|nr:response regulator [Crocinitomicaceae bacterium]MCF8444245.1 response regulator [Crocinitomicaceae bacterium]
MDQIKYAVVCVDDDPHILQMLSFQLEKIIDSKCTLIEYFTNPEDVITNVKELALEEIDIVFILVDYQMPQMNGVQLIRTIKAINPKMECVMLSGQANSVQVAELTQDNLLTEFIHKPWDEQTLFDVLSPLLKNKTN